MALLFLLDENLRGPLWHAIEQHNAGGVDVFDCLCVGEPPAPPRGTADPDLLLWCEANGRVLVSRDRRLVAMHLPPHFQAGHHTAGVLIADPPWTIPAFLAALILYDQCHDPPDMVDQTAEIP